MNREEIIELAREANISVFEDNTFADDMYISVLYRFANLVAASEREACARVCELMRPSKREYDHRFYDACTASAAVIRTRGNDESY